MQENSRQNRLQRRDFLRLSGAMAGTTALSRFTGAKAGEISLPAPQEPFSPAEQKLLDAWQLQTLKLFTDPQNAYTQSTGLALERTNWAAEKDYQGKVLLATGATGFGVMSLLAAVKRGKEERSKAAAEGKRPEQDWPTEEQAREHIGKLVNFLETKCTRYHGAFSHWVEPDGKTFSPPWAPAENGGDLLETSFLIMGLLCAREYFKDDPKAREMCNGINRLWEEVDWKWYTKNGKENTLYWHYSPDRGFEKNMPISGWCEGLVTYVLAASAPKEEHRIPREVYDEGWGGPMKTRAPKPEDATALQYQYSMAGLDPRGLKDGHLLPGCADYWEQGKRFISANYQHCVDNPKQFTGYGPDCWGLSESDGPPSADLSRNKYQARCPVRDDGTIATAVAPCSLIYLPKESLAAMKRFMDDPHIWDKYGPVDSFNLKDDSGKPWYDRVTPAKPEEKGEPVYIGIHQLPIGAIIENQRSGLLWNLFMQCPEVKQGMQRLGMQSPHLSAPRVAASAPGR